VRLPLPPNASRAPDMSTAVPMSSPSHIISRLSAQVSKQLGSDAVEGAMTWKLPLAALAILALAGSATAQDLDCIAVPFMVVKLASSVESIIRKIDVDRGDAVK